MGYNARNDEIRDNITRMKREWEAQRDALATVRRFNARLSAKGYSWFWPKVATEHYSLQNLKLRILTCLDYATEPAKRGSPDRWSGAITKRKDPCLLPVQSIPKQFVHSAERAWSTLP